MYWPKSAGQRKGGPQSNQFKRVPGAQLLSTAELATRRASRDAAEVPCGWRAPCPPLAEGEGLIRSSAVPV